MNFFIRFAANVRRIPATAPDRLVLLALLLGTLGGLSQPVPAPVPATTAASLLGNAGPRIQFAQPVFDFGKMESGGVTNHSFVFTNAGNQTLVLRDVRPSCGCTTTGGWDKEVEPGKGGTISVKFNSAGFSGDIHKTVIVVCNDRFGTNVVLQMKGTVWKPIEVTPPAVVFSTTSDSEGSETRVLRILNNTDEPLMLSDPECTNRAFHATLKPVKAGKEFELHVTFAPPSRTGSVSAPLTLKTSRPNLPVVTVMAHGVMRPAVVATPAQATLPPGPLTGGATASITIRNNGTNSLTLSEPTVSARGGEVKIQELQPGRLFRLALSFPDGFHIEPGQTVEARVKTNHPQFPMISVPVVQGQSLASSPFERSPDTLEPSPPSIGAGSHAN